MRAMCPKCEATYELPPELAARLPASVRCARCGNAWEIQAEIGVPAMPLPPKVSKSGTDSGSQGGPERESDIESKTKLEVAEAPAPATAASAPAPSGLEKLLSPKPPAAEKRDTKPAVGAGHPRGEGKGTVGLAPAATSLPVPEPVAAKPAEADEEEEADEEAPLPDAAVRLQWIVSLLVLAAAIALILVLHRPIGHAWPPMMRIYHALGLG